MARSEATVRQKAYELWQTRGGGHGHDQDDWYAAELVVTLEEASHRPLRPPSFRPIAPREILDQVQISHVGIREFFSPSHSWIETLADVETIFAFDRNRRLHFDEGFLNASYRVAKDLSITHIDETSHFPYRDLPAVRQKIRDLTALYQSGAELLPPLFFYPSPCQLEILDGVHRCMAAFEALPALEPGSYKIWLGFDHRALDAALVVQQLWSDGLSRMPAMLRARDG